MQVYVYSPTTFEYRGTDIAHESPMEPGQFLIPAHATTIAPPEIAAKQAAVFADGKWSTVPDHRGERWYKPDGSEVTVSDINVVPDATWTHEPPPPPPPSAEQLRQELVQQAQDALDLTDRVALRCFKARVVFPVGWQRYVVALRNIVNGADTTSTSLPRQPKLPKGS